MPQINRRFTDFRRFPRSISVKSIVVVMSQRRDLPLSPWWGRALPPILIVGFILGFLEAMQGWQCFLEVKAMPYRHRVGTHKIRTYPPNATIYVDFFFCGNVGVIFVRKSVHLEDYFFRATQFEHGLSEPCITNNSIVNVLVFSFYALHLELICSVVFFTAFFLPVPVDRVAGLSWCKSSG